jgi:hypothetical protein
MEISQQSLLAQLIRTNKEEKELYIYMYTSFISSLIKTYIYTCMYICAHTNVCVSLYLYAHTFIPR